MKRNNVKQITIRLTADEYAHVKQLSKDSGLKMEPAIRRLIMGVNLRPRPPDELPELLRQLSGIGTNINQIAKVANASGYVRKEDIQSIMEMQAALWRAVKRGYCTDISWENAQPGDLVFYPDNSHVGIVGGRGANGKLLIIHCASGYNNVVITGKEGFTSVGRPQYYGE